MNAEPELAETCNKGVLTVKVLAQVVPIPAEPVAVSCTEVVPVTVPEPLIPPVVALRTTVLPETGPATTRAGALTE